MDLSNWRPYTPQKICGLLKDKGVPFWIAGGYALELFVGSPYRGHADLDIVIPRTEQQQLRKVLADFCFYAADPPGQLRVWPGDELLAKPIEDVWVKERAAGPFVFQIMFLETVEDRWLFKRNPQVTGLISEFGWISPEGYPVIGPHIQLLYKAKTVREKDALDFATCQPRLNESQRQWLIDALELVHPSHPWLNELV